MSNTQKNHLVLIDKEQYILDGTLISIGEMKGINKKAKLDEQSVNACVQDYKQNVILKGMAFGSLQPEVKAQLKDEISEEELLNLTNSYGLTANYEEEEISEDEVAFQVLDMMFDRENARIFGRIQVLDTPEGIKAKEKINRGMICYISSSGVDDVIDRDKRFNLRTTGRWEFIHKFHRIKGGWKMSFIGEEKIYQSDLK